MTTPDLTLYSFPLSGHAHRIQLALSLMGLPFHNQIVDLPGGEHKSTSYLSINPEGKVPALKDGETVITESTAILTYLAAKYDTENRFIPASPEGAAAVARYFAQASGPVASGPARARLITVFGAPFDAEKTIEDAHTYLTGLDKGLVGRTFLVGDAVTFADVAIYSYVAHAPEGHVSLAPYANIRRWIAAVEATDGFVPMPKTEVNKAAE